MTGKKIEFPQKPILQNQNDYIDNWVAGNNRNNIKENKIKRTTVYLPEELHKKLKIVAVKKEGTMSDIMIEAIEKYLLKY